MTGMTETPRCPQNTHNECESLRQAQVRASAQVDELLKDHFRRIEVILIDPETGGRFIASYKPGTDLGLPLRVQGVSHCTGCVGFCPFSVKVEKVFEADPEGELVQTGLCATVSVQGRVTSITYES